ncbi:hypothetical protein K3725_09870 [Leisingera sp. S132]|uniref:hypothetical protein n=1 Tax=Leisingera sp. S132 TaxID=2867016 RepID=UPI0021A74F85|nr:hypothetical protein [Leisingera sp. S132]UWQ77630.1 hypothetical protein K3725_09870 [Leisingera sp. S132]
MTQHTQQTAPGKAGACQVLHLGNSPRFAALPDGALHDPANGVTEIARRRAERAAALSARIQRRIAEMGYSTRPPALIAPGALA